MSWLHYFSLRRLLLFLVGFLLAWLFFAWRLNIHTALVSMKNINRAILQRCMSPTAHNCSHTLRSQLTQFGINFSFIYTGCHKPQPNFQARTKKQGKYCYGLAIARNMILSQFHSNSGGSRVKNRFYTIMKESLQHSCQDRCDFFSSKCTTNY